ncbi:hypothetical protein SAMN05428937_3728 [Achromobacter sp. MFA1 R4]|nr:hypothetical protein SAMN05428937_0019 [Achromobacter sp. MFA1 R4]SIT27891.1 hypothetical protein SAMN05428937_3728 [Achromobacter sp. MFA1 R4]
MNKQDLDAIATREAHCKPYGSAVTLSIGERDELVALARDGMRYRWLRVQPNDTQTPRIDVVHWVEEGDVNAGSGLRMEELDSAIDAAMAKEGA